MQIKSKYKVARRVGAPIYEKTQLPKFELRESRRGKKEMKHPRQKSDYGIQMLEKQKVRYTYNLLERQFVKYVRETMAKGTASPTEELFRRLETRLDNVVYRAGFAPTRLAARQMVNHGHIMVNGERLSIPSYQTKLTDKITIRPQSAKQPLFANIDAQIKAKTVQSWLAVDADKKMITPQGVPKYDKVESGFNLATIFEFYSR